MNHGPIEIRLGVYRRRDSLEQGLPDEPKALLLHNRRRDVLHETLSDIPGVHVSDWGETDDTKPHEWVEIILHIIENPAFKTGLIWVGSVVGKAVLSAVTSEAVKEIIHRLRTKSVSKEIEGFTVTDPQSTAVIQCDLNGNLKIAEEPTDLAKGG